MAARAAGAKRDVRARAECIFLGRRRTQTERPAIPTSNAEEIRSSGHLLRRSLVFVLPRSERPIRCRRHYCGGRAGNRTPPASGVAHRSTLPGIAEVRGAVVA